MSYSRRRLLVVFGSLAVAGGASAPFLSPNLRDRARAVVARVFGEEIARHPATASFLGEFEAYVRGSRKFQPVGIVYRMKLAYIRLVPFGLRHTREMEQVLARIVTEKFATSTNVVRRVQTGEELMFVALFDPYETPCGNQLSAAHAA